MISDYFPLKTGQLCIQPWPSAYLKQLYALLIDRQVSSLLGTDFGFFTLKKYQLPKRLSIIVNEQTLALEPIWLILAIYSKKEQKIIGCCGLKKKNKKSVAELFCCILPRYWRQGWANEACQVLLKSDFSQKKYQEIGAYILPHNLAAQGLASKIGLHYCQKEEQKRSGKVLQLQYWKLDLNNA